MSSAQPHTTTQQLPSFELWSTISWFLAVGTTTSPRPSARAAASLVPRLRHRGVEAPDRPRLRAVHACGAADGGARGRKKLSVQTHQLGRPKSRTAVVVGGAGDDSTTAGTAPPRRSGPSAGGRRAGSPGRNAFCFVGGAEDGQPVGRRAEAAARGQCRNLSYIAHPFARVPRRYIGT